jgi:NAD(P)-dependent dehydrogenase (short-subunit alcohol dehydrogenase family)
MIMALNPPISNWSQRVVWLVGASTGIGRALAEQLHAKGAKVIVSARKAEPLEAFEAAHAGSLGLAVDATDPSSMQQAMQRILLKFGRLDMVVYCAGHYKAMRATTFDLAEAVQQNRVNYEGALNMLNAVLPVLIAQRHGHVSLVSSVAGLGGLPLGLAYGPTKAALINLAEALYMDLSPMGIATSVINPGFVETPMTAQNTFTMPALISPDEAARHMLHGWAQGRFEIHFPKRFTLWVKALQFLPRGLYFRAVRRLTGL